MKVVVILDVNPIEGDARREREAVQQEVEDHIDAALLDVPSPSGQVSLHQIKVSGIGADVAQASLSFAQRKQYARQDETVGGG